MLVCLSLGYSGLASDFWATHTVENALGVTEFGLILLNNFQWHLRVETLLFDNELGWLFIQIYFDGWRAWWVHFTLTITCSFFILTRGFRKRSLWIKRDHLIPLRYPWLYLLVQVVSRFQFFLHSKILANWSYRLAIRYLWWGDWDLRSVFWSETSCWLNLLFWHL